MKKLRIVTLTRDVWRRIAAQAAGQTREGGGLLVGRRTRRGNFIVSVEIGLTHVEADEMHIRYNRDEVALARKMAYEMYAPLEPIGAWHSHPWPGCTMEALLPQISDDWDDPMSDVVEMQDGDIEVIIASFPKPDDYQRKSSDTILQRILINRVCRGEAWYRGGYKDVKACQIRLCSGRG